MRERLLRVASVLRLTRVTTAFAAVANIWFVILWSRTASGEEPPALLLERPLWILLTGGALAAVGLYAFGTCLNDLFDLHRDQQLRPGRPLASGMIRLDTAVVSTAITLIAAVLGAATFGTVGVVITLALLLAVLIFNTTGKFIPGIGLLLLGLIYAGHMFVPNVNLKFVWPVWLVMTHALVAGGLSHVLGRKTPPLTRRAVAFAVAGWLIWSITLFAMASAGSSLASIRPDAYGVAGPVLCIILAGMYALTVVRKHRSLGPGPRLGEKTHRYGTIYLALYACAWLVGSGFYRPAAVMGGLALVGIVGMIVMREIYGLVEHPVGYRH